MSAPGPSVPPRFLADAMLERLARWLRVLGVDVASVDSAAADREIAQRAAAEGRVVLTRDRRLPREWALGAHAVVRSADPHEQLREVVSAFGIEVPRELFTRCLLCNVPLRPATDDEIAAAGRALGAPVRRCPRCGRVYWEGAHTRRMRAALARVLPLTHPPARDDSGGREGLD